MVPGLVKKKSGYKLDPVEISLPLGWDVSCNPEKTNWDMFQNLSKIKTSTYSTTSTGSSHDFQGFIAWFPGVSYIFSIVSSGTVRKNHWVSQTLPQILRAEATVSGDAPAWNENLPFRCGEQQDMNGFCLYFHKMHGTGEFTYLYIYTHIYLY